MTILIAADHGVGRSKFHRPQSTPTRPRRSGTIPPRDRTDEICTASGAGGGGGGGVKKGRGYLVPASRNFLHFPI